MKKLLLFLALFTGMVSTAQTTSEISRILNGISTDLVIDGQAAQSALGNNILLASAGTGSFDAVNNGPISYRSFYVQVTGTAGISAGQIIFEGSNDNTNFVPITWYDDAVVTGTTIIAATAIAANTNRFFSGKITYRYFRCRISTAFVGGTVSARVRYSPYDYVPRVTTVGNPTAANLAVTASIAGSQTLATVTTVGTVSTVTNGNLGTNSLIADVASAAITTTTTTAAFTPTFGVAYQIAIPVTVATGTTPTLDVSVEESDDNGTNWFKVYDFPRITTTGIYRSPRLVLRGTRVRYVQTVTGTTPSFTRAINRIQMSGEADRRISQLIDRTVSLTTLSATTPAINVQAAEALQLSINIGAATTPPALQLQVSDDNGLTWTNIGSPLTAVASSTVNATITNINAQLVRAIVTTAGTGVTAGYVLVKGF
jgi:hypothetical protein